MFSISQILDITKGTALQLAYPEDRIEHLLIDSRKVVFAQTSLFFAIKGERHDGHLFLSDLMQKGVRNFIVTEAPNPEKELSSISFGAGDFCNIIVVSDAVRALQQIASAHRAKFSYPVIGITGSNGKTIVKEWLYQLLSPNFRIVRSPKSYNSQVGVPLSVWEMSEQHNLAIFEAGISQVGEMENLERIIKPTIGIFTNLGSAHDEGFENREQKKQEKMKLFKDCEIVYSKALTSKVEEILPHKIDFTQNFEVLNIATSENYSILHLAYQNQPFEIKIPTTDLATIENTLTCLCVLLHFHVPLGELQARFDALRPVAMRLEMKEAINQSYLIDDSYNNDLNGLQMALQFMKLQKQAEKSVVILSDMLETNLPDEQLYQTIFEMLQEIKVDIVVGIGKRISKAFETLKAPNLMYAFPTTESFLASAVCTSFHNALILVKGARSFAFEQIVKKLQKKAHGTVLEINLDALTHNLNFYRSLLKPPTKVMAMVKAFAYGSGSAEVAQWLQFHRVDYLGVAYVDEGVFLRKNGITLPIMVLNPTVESFELCAEYNLEPEIYSFKILEEFINFAQYHNQQTFKSSNLPPCHLKLDTGMRRLGFEPHEVRKLADTLVDKLPFKIKVASVFSHMAGADEEKHNEFSQQQIALFRQGASILEEKLGYTFLKHIANSPAIARFPEAHFDMVRLGVGLYGVEATNLYPNNLETVTTFKTIISQIKHIKAGETVGYGRWGKAEQDMKIATMAVGYADGFLRRLSRGVGKVGIHGKLASVVGNVCMDMTMIDITGIDANEGDEVIIFGEAPNPTIFDMAEALKTIPYEVLTLVSERVKRVFFTT
jgi:alanine racemase